MKRVLLVINKFMDIYKDIQNELEKQGYLVTHVEDISYKDDPYLIRDKRQGKSAYEAREKYYTKYWSEIICQSKDEFVFDYLFAVEGFSICGYLIEYLVRKNPNIIKRLYLYDKTFENYQFDLNFKYFDKVFTFDRFDSQHYNIPLLPIYWVPMSQNNETKYSIFGFASYQKERYDIFKKVFSKTNALTKSSFIKVYIPCDRSGVIKRVLKNVRSLLTGQLLDSSLVSHFALSPSEFRQKILESDIILDTHNSFQDGLTARFCWAIGLGKKIMTTNTAAKDYDFFDPNGICIIDKNAEIPEAFLNSSYVQAEIAVSTIEKFRIDNWVKTILS